MRKALFWIHLTAGLVAGIVILIMSITGVLLGFERQIVTWADHRANRPVSVATTGLLGIDDLLAHFTAPPTAVTLHNHPDEPIEVSLGRDRTLFLDPYNGSALGEGSKPVRAFFASVVSWHRWIAAAGTLRPTGRAITGAANLIFLFIVISGPILWLPAKLRWKNLRAILVFRRGLSGKARDWNWHNVIGIWSSIPLLFIVATGVVMSYPWANDLLYRITGTAPPAVAERQRDRVGPLSNGLDPLIARAKAHVPAWRAISIRPSAANTVTFTIDEGNGGQPHRRGQLTLDRGTAQVVRWEPFESNNAGRRLRLWSRFVHTGEALGTAGQVVATLATAGTVVLIWTGLALTWRRYRSWSNRRAA